MSFWIVGTDTEVGKTVVSGLVLRRYAESHSLAYWKPVATGREEDHDLGEIRAWLSDSVVTLDEVYLFDPPLSPHLAARLAGVEIDPERILGDLVLHGMADKQRNLIIENAGGVLVPLTDQGYLFIQLIAETALPVVVVARSTLGTINHTLLTLEALRARGIEVIGVVLNGPANKENRKAIEKFGKVRIISEVTPIPTLSQAAVSEAAKEFDPLGVIEEYLG